MQTDVRLEHTYSPALQAAVEKALGWERYWMWAKRVLAGLMLVLAALSVALAGLVGLRATGLYIPTLLLLLAAAALFLYAILAKADWTAPVRGWHLRENGDMQVELVFPLRSRVWSTGDFRGLQRLGDKEVAPPVAAVMKQEGLRAYRIRFYWGRNLGHGSGDFRAISSRQWILPFVFFVPDAMAKAFEQNWPAPGKPDVDQSVYSILSRGPK